MQKIFTSLALLLSVATASAQDDSYQLDQTYPMSPTGTIDLRASDARVAITGSKRKDAHVRVERKVTVNGVVQGKRTFRVEVTPENGNLKFRDYREGENTSVTGYYKEDYRITIEAPEGASLQVDGNDGTYIITNVDGNLSLELNDFDARLTGCSGDSFRFRTNDGTLVMDEGRGTLDLDGNDGDVNIRNGRFERIDAKWNDGDLRIATSLTNTGSYRIHSQDGSLDLAVTGGGGVFDISHDDGHVSRKGNFTVLREEENRTRLQLNGGSAQVRVQAGDASVRLTAGQ
jgi:hypothetical protein